MIVAVTGSTGLIGAALVEALEADGHFVRRLVRRDVRNERNEIHWNPNECEIDADALEGSNAVVHLAGENLAAHRWTESFKAMIRDSRVCGTRLLCDTLAGLATKPDVLVSASAVGYYGDRGDEIVNESSPPGKGFLADVCQQWEAATQPARSRFAHRHLRVGGAFGRSAPRLQRRASGGDRRGQQLPVRRDRRAGPGCPT